MPSEILSEKLLHQLGQKVAEYNALSGNCAQTAFLTIQELFDLDGGSILKALTPFPGIGLRGETCGAVTGPLMALGLVFGRDRDQLGDWSIYTASLRPARHFCSTFEKELGSTMCGDLVEAKFGRRFNLADPAESMEWAKCGAVEKCGEIICTGVRIASEIIASNSAR